MLSPPQAPQPQPPRDEQRHQQTATGGDGEVAGVAEVVGAEAGEGGGAEDAQGLQWDQPGAVVAEAAGAEAVD